MKPDQYQSLISKNQSWVQEQLSNDVNSFTEMSKGQTPPYFIISCADSRIPPNIITKSSPGEIFSHRNVANIICNEDDSVKAALEYAVLHLKVQHIIVCGHTGCGGVTAAIEDNVDGSIKSWISPIRKLYLEHEQEIKSANDDASERINHLARLNVKEGINCIKKMPSLRAAFDSNSPPEIHGWIFDLNTGKILEV